MNLEDSLGDILRKARLSTHTSPEDAAEVAGLGLTEYAQLEDTGVAPTTTQFEPLGKRLTLDGKRLAGLAAGWRPRPVDVTRWSCLQMVTTSGDGMTVNAYLIWDPTTREAALFDTGFEAGAIFEVIDRHRLALKDIFITHSHGDHVAALGPIRGRFPAVRVHSGSDRAPADQRLQPGRIFEIGQFRIAHQATPGHAEDGITYIVTGWPGDAPAVAIVGDALFAGSMGGARDQLALARAKVRDVILSLADQTLVGPGHGPWTTVGEEKTNNPWFP
jgi:hydroxyacylglutathione hydrolase